MPHSALKAVTDPAIFAFFGNAFHQILPETIDDIARCSVFIRGRLKL